MGCDIHSLLVVRDNLTNKVVPVVSNVKIGKTTTRLDPCNFRDYFVFGLLTDGTVRSDGMEGFNIPFRGRYPLDIERSGDKDTDNFVNAYMDKENDVYHSHTYVTDSSLTLLEDALYRERNKCLHHVSEESFQTFLELDCAYNVIRRITDYMREVNYNLWEQDMYDNYSIELLLMFDS